jgi:hypothetical protein
MLTNEWDVALEMLHGHYLSFMGLEGATRDDKLHSANKEQ